MVFTMIAFAGRLAIVALLAWLVWWVHASYTDYRAATSSEVTALVRKLADAKKACHAGPPGGPACTEASRLVIDLERARRRE